MNIQPGDCVKIPDGRIGRVRGIDKGLYKIRVRRTTSASHQFLTYTKDKLITIDCPAGWMSKSGYNRYLKITLAKMKMRNKKK